ncbi:MAG: tRNA (N6-isopentenyl adenosine(37)-C2)-methylthiotransferase MiaB [Bacteroidales bacterium]
MATNFNSVRPILNENFNKVYIETYGCQMNVSDSEVVLSILQPQGYSLSRNYKDASLILINTCSIRENAEQRVWARLRELNSLKRKNRALKIGVLGCMAERLEAELLDSGLVDMVAGPDSYRTLPQLIDGANSGELAANTILSQEESYADITPVRLDKNGVSAFVSIMRGCNNFCTYCVVPYVRGRERSRDPKTILEEVKLLFESGYREVTLLGQNVNSYCAGENITFAKLLEQVALIAPQLRVRFSTSHPKDIGRELIDTIAAFPNICKHIHLPVQSGSNSVLKRMNRNYSREEYLQKIDYIKKRVPNCSISTDIIAGFSGESEEEHQETLSIMREVGYYTAFMFQYSQREGTVAAKRYPNDVPPKVKGRRLQEIIELQNSLSLLSNQNDVGQEFEILVEGRSKRNKEELFGRSSQNKVVIIPAKGHKVGDFVKVRVTSCSSATLKGEAVE